MATKLGTLGIWLTANDRQLKKVFDGAALTVARFGNKVGAAGKRLTTGVTVPMAGIGAVAVRQFAAFDDAMVKSTAIMQGMTNELETQLKEKAIEVSKETTTSAEELAKSYFFLASAGMNAADSVKNLGTVEKFATAGNFEMSTATDLLTDAQKALGAETHSLTRVSDVLVKANTLANASVEQFSMALTNEGAPALRGLNKTIEEGVAVLAAFADQGIKGEVAGTKLRIVIRDLQRAYLKNTDAWGDGTVYDKTTGKMKNLADIIGFLETRFSGMSDMQKKQEAELLGFQDRSFSAITALLGMSKEIRRYEKLLREAGGTTNIVAEKNLSSFSSKLKILVNRLNAIAMSIGERVVPVLERLAVEMEKGIAWWDSLSESTKDWYVNAGLIAIAAGPVLQTFNGVSIAIANIIQISKSFIGLQFVQTFKSWTIGANAFNGALGGISASLGTIGLVLGAAWKGWELGTWLEEDYEIGTKLLQVIEDINSAVGGAVHYVARLNPFYELADRLGYGLDDIRVSGAPMAMTAGGMALSGGDISGFLSRQNGNTVSLDNESRMALKEISANTAVAATPPISIPGG